MQHQLLGTRVEHISAETTGLALADTKMRCLSSSSERVLPGDTRRNQGRNGLSVA